MRARYLFAVVPLALLCVTAAATDNAVMSPQELAVRNAYAKLSYAADLRTIYRAALVNPSINPADLAAQVETQKVKFTLSNFVIGDLRGIADVKFTKAFPQYPDGQNILQISLDTENFTDIDGEKQFAVAMDTAIANWTKGPIGSPPSGTVGEMIPVLEEESGVQEIVSYCTFTVTVAYGGSSRTYQSYFFFGPNGEPAPADTVAGLGGGALQHFLRNPAYPTGLLQTSLWGKSKAVRDFVLANQKTNPSCKKGDACCDVVAVQCGVFSGDLIGRQQ
jgi:hypothetical protein